MNIQKMMKEAQKMQERLAKAQSDLAEQTLEVSAGGGKVTVSANGTAATVKNYNRNSVAVANVLAYTGPTRASFQPTVPTRPPRGR